MSGSHEALDANGVIELQRTAGNSAVTAAIQRKAIASGGETAALEDLDLTDQSAISPSIRAKDQAIARSDKDRAHHNVTITNKNYVGGYENAGADHPVPTIHVGTEGRAAGGETLLQLQSDYNAYTPLLRATLKSMGRLKDLDAAGAKLDPAALKADPKVAAKFTSTAASGKLAGVALNAWSDQATEEEIAVESMRAGFQQLNAAIHGFRAAETMLKHRQKQAKLENAEAKKEKIDQTVETLEKIVDTCFKAYEMAEGIETFLDTTRDVKDLEAVEAKESYKESHSKQQSLGRAATVVEQQIQKHKGKAKDWLKEGGLTFKNVLIFATNNEQEYEQLTTQIAQLKSDLADLEFKKEDEQIREAEDQLEGMKLEIGVRIKQTRAKRDAARAAAGSFGDIMAGDEGTLAMYAAQAYMDLAINGGAANRQRESRIDPYLGWLYGFLKDNAYVALGHGWKPDWNDLQEWGQEMVEQRDFFSGKQPDWSKKAAEWNAFFEEVTAGPLVK